MVSAFARERSFDLLVLAMYVSAILAVSRMVLH
jgi:hypothetical protein